MIVITCTILVLQLSQNILINSFNKPERLKETDDIIALIPNQTTFQRLKKPLLGDPDFTSSLPQLQYTFKPENSTEKSKRESRKQSVKKAFLHAWNGYNNHALGFDEIAPLSNRTKNTFGGWGATLVDSLSTLLVMELNNEFTAALPEVAKIKMVVDQNVSVFETTIRYIGGLLSAYELSGEKALLVKADQFGEMILPAFDTPFGLPYHTWNSAKQKGTNNHTLVADVGTVQLELITLSFHTRKPIYAEKAQKITEFLDSVGYAHGLFIPGLYPSGINLYKGRFTDAVCTFGAMGDSVFEYFLKEHVLLDGSVRQYSRMYIEAIDNMKIHMLQQLPGTSLLFLPPFDTRKKTFKKSMDHLTCFAPGMLAMGATLLDRPEDMIIAKGLLETCVYMYRTSSTGLCPETWLFPATEPYNPLTYSLSDEEMAGSHEWWYNTQLPPPPLKEKFPAKQTDIFPDIFKFNSSSKNTIEGLMATDRRYLLRPETVESLYILYRMTGDTKYQEYGWEIFEAIEKWCKTPSAYASIRNVNILEIYEQNIQDNQLDSMESFLLAETFKYLYLLFSPTDHISLDKFVFNTEAHPFMRRSWA
ncbi:glycoside hydrolase family 47 protein [Phycomyces blakesleeanus NRRL 1555(-)]|uniref:alpha-1,2-Mannosidase n=2 Tax=Phycomyces blakesleeanus TaxID=4837 RepID=A0A162V941_PHYB8|nr:glycoside hydrolase family 47 protein [Phycomyces blakesleeanus NRRL 1555(-)]OAD80912.1 glycoside hydrolase family 47 protein [Phycomyces blakesleeanus NRRL 1555(-)]|eukprot:XP_018298952.1 glycoside hydrolase family 47 protein [Phycomyces blakesleeanus NRRL 1555(-)]